MRARGAALCCAETEPDDKEGAKEPQPLVATAPFGYLRLRRAEYSDADLAAWGERIRGQGWSEAYVFFKHEDDGTAPRVRASPDGGDGRRAGLRERGLSDLFAGDGRKPEDSAARFVPAERDLDKLKAAAAGCTGCALHERATQTVFGEGQRRAAVMLVGEQPGDQEDLQGRPFVGPAGQLLDWSLEKAGIDRGQAYVTNVVKHFKWVPRGKRRIHSKPSSLEIKACLPWLEAELEAVEPEVIVLLGATAAQALLGASFRVTRERGEWLRSNLAPHVMATVHPSSLLRIEDDAERKEAIRVFVRELRQVAEVLASAD